MKGTEQFKRVIEAHLKQMAASDQVFAAKLQNENKNIDNCIKYILNTVKKSGCNAFADDEIFGMAIHYYDEENIEAGGPISAQVVVNHVPELTEEEKKQARQEAMNQLVAEEKAKMQKRLATKVEKQKTEKPVAVVQPSLFGDE